MELKENFYKGSNRTYTVLHDVTWNEEAQKIKKRISPIGKVEGETFTPSKKLEWLMKRYDERPGSLSEKEKELIKLVIETYNGRIEFKEEKEDEKAPKKMIKLDQSEVKRGFKRIEDMLEAAFGSEDAEKLMHLGWQSFLKRKPDNIEPGMLELIAPKYVKLGSQALDELVNRIEVEGICDAYERFKSNNWIDAFLNVDLVTKSVPCELLPFPMGEGLEAYITIARSRTAGMPLSCWPGSLTYANMRPSRLFRFLKGLSITPRCAMLGDEYASPSKISSLFKPGVAFLQMVNPNYAWVREAIRDDWNFYKMNSIRLDGRVYYYGADTEFRWVSANVKTNSEYEDSSQLRPLSADHYEPGKGETVTFELPCHFHKPYSKEVASKQRVPFLEKLHDEYELLNANSLLSPSPELRRFFAIEQLGDGTRLVEFKSEAVDQQVKSIFGFTCFITNDPSIVDTKDALLDYSIREYISRPFFERKPENTAVYDEDRLFANTFVFFLSEVICRLVDKQD